MLNYVNNNNDTLKRVNKRVVDNITCAYSLQLDISVLLSQVDAAIHFFESKHERDEQHNNTESYNRA